jgi:hypothetical protein
LIRAAFDDITQRVTSHIVIARPRCAALNRFAWIKRKPQKQAKNHDNFTASFACSVRNQM